MSREEGRCTDVNPATGRRCRLVSTHVVGHRWWTGGFWNAGKRREEWK